MATINALASRTSSLLTSDRLVAALRRTQVDLARISAQISTGVSVSRASEAPAKAGAILLVQSQLEARGQYEGNLQLATSALNQIDASLAEASDILLEARDIGSAQIGIGSNRDTRQNQAAVIDGMIQSLLDIANRRQNEISLFGGAVSPRGDQEAGSVFTSFLGGVRYLGARDNLAADVGLPAPLAFNSNGVDAFGALSSRVYGTVDLDPQATDDTRIADLAGANGLGVRLGAVQVVVDGTAVTVDLSGAERLGDVVLRLNDAINSVDPTAGSLATGGGAGGLALTANLGHSISIGESGAGQTAGDLGLIVSATGATVAGGDLDPRLSLLTDLSSLGAAIDWTGGLKITQGNQTRMADFSSATTIQDLSNQVNRLGLGLRLEINAQGNGLNLVSEVSGLELSIGENAGGTTATDLGLRSFDRGTDLSALNHGLGVANPAGVDFSVQLHDGSLFSVNLDGATTVGQVIDAVRSAAEAALGAGAVGAPGDAGTLFNVGLALDGNGLVLEDGTAGAADFEVRNLGLSLAATDLGILVNAGAGGSIAGQDVAKVRAEGVFTHLALLSQALRNDDSRGITLATSRLEVDIDQMARTRADVGVRAQRAEQQVERSQEMKIAEQTLLEDLRGVDMAEAITRFQQLQLQMEASLQVGAQNLQLSLLDFLR